MVSRGCRCHPAAAVPDDVHGPQRASLDAGVPDGHAGIDATGERTVPRLCRARLALERGSGTMKQSNSFPALLHSFFYERLVEQQNVSPHTVRSYRDAWRLFL